MKLTESFKTAREEEHPEMYIDGLPSLAHHLHAMIKSRRYVFAADFLARGYRFDRTSAEKMWRMICIPESVTVTDICSAIFTGNPELGGVEEQSGIWESDVLKKAGDFASFIDVHRGLDVNGSDVEKEDDDEVETGDDMLDLSLASDDQDFGNESDNSDM